MFVALVLSDRHGLTSCERRLAVPNRRPNGAMLQGNGRPALNGDVGLECGGIPVAFDLDPGESRADLGKIGGVERDVGRADVLLKAVNLGRPRERDLGARRALARGDRPQKLD